MLITALVICVALAAIRLHQGYGWIDALVSALTLAIAALRNIPAAHRSIVEGRPVAVRYGRERKRGSHDIPPFDRSRSGGIARPKRAMMAKMSVNILTSGSAPGAM